MIKNIIFDVGEVLIGYRWKEMLMDYGLEDSEADTVGSIMFGDNLWRKFDLAIEPFDNIINEYREKYPDYAEEIEWFIRHGENMSVPYEDVWKKVGELKKCGYNIFLLSNYSKELFDKHTKNADFLKYLDGRIISYEVHLLKPDKRIYESLLEKYSLEAGECIFFDDREENVEGAIATGINAIQITSKEQTINQIDKLIKDRSIYNEKN